MGIENPKQPEGKNTSNLARQAEAYDKLGGERYDQEATRRGWQVPSIVYEKLKPMLKEGQRLIDIGGGSGLSAEPFQEAGLEMRGVDGSTELLNTADKKGVYSLGTEQVLIGHDELETNHEYDYAISFGTMSIIPLAKQELLAAMQKSVKAGGIVSFNYLDPQDYPRVKTIENEVGDLIDSQTIEQEQQRFFHRQADIHERCEELGFVVEDETKAISYPNREPGKQNPTRIVIARYSPA